MASYGLHPCPACGGREWADYQGRLGRLQCQGCFRVFPVKEIHYKLPTTRKTHEARARIRRSRKNETKRAREIGGHRVIGSGSLSSPSMKGDVAIVGLLREEEKETEAGSFTLKLETLDKIRVEALALGEQFALHLTFLQPRPKSFVVIDKGFFDDLLELARENHRRVEGG